MEHAVLLGLAMTAYIFAYYAFNLRDSEVEGNQRLAVLLAVISLAFTNLLFYATYLVAENTTTYLTGGLLETGLLIMTWATNIILAYMLAAGIWMMIKYLMESFTQGIKGRSGGGDRDE